MRLFTAVVPPPEVLDHLRGALPATAPSGVRWSEPETWHVTLGFHGDVPAGALEDLTDALAAAAGGVTPFRIHLAGAGTFSGRTVWVGVGGETRGLQTLVSGVRSAARAVGLPDDARLRVRHHLTMARATRPGGATVAADLVRALAVYRGPEWDVTRVTLVESHLGEGRSGGPRHVEIADLMLGRG